MLKIFEEDTYQCELYTFYCLQSLFLKIHSLWRTLMKRPLDILEQTLCVMSQQSPDINQDLLVVTT